MTDEILLKVLKKAMDDKGFAIQIADLFQENGLGKNIIQKYTVHVFELIRKLEGYPDLDIIKDHLEKESMSEEDKKLISELHKRIIYLPEVDQVTTKYLQEELIKLNQYNIANKIKKQLSVNSPEDLDDKTLSLTKLEFDKIDFVWDSSEQRIDMSSDFDYLALFKKQDEDRIIEFPWQELNEGLPSKGIKKTDFISIGGGTGKGKSMILMQTAVNAIKNGFNVCYFSFENDFLTDIERMLRMYYKCDKDKALLQLKQGIKAPKWYFEKLPTLSKNAFQILEKVKNIAKQNPIDILFIDYADKLTTRTKVVAQQPHIRLKTIYDELKIMRDELDIPVVTAHQLNRQSRNGTAGLETVSGSWDAYTNCSLVIHIKQKDLDFADPSEFQIEIEKGRNGGEKTSVDLKRNPDSLRAESYSDVVPKKIITTKENKVHQSIIAPRMGGGNA